MSVPVRGGIRSVLIGCRQHRGLAQAASPLGSIDSGVVVVPLGGFEERDSVPDHVEGVHGFAGIVRVLTTCDAAFDCDKMSLVGVLGDRVGELPEARDGDVVGGGVGSVDGEGEVHSGFVVRCDGVAGCLRHPADQVHGVHFGPLPFGSAVPGWRPLVNP